MTLRTNIFSTLLFSVTFLCVVPVAHATDPFVDVIEGETTLKMVFDHGDVCEFMIDSNDPKEAAAAVGQKITKLYDIQPTVRGTTQAWDIDNTKAKSTQSKTVSILIKQERDGRYHLTMDRRRGGERHNSQNAKTYKDKASQSRRRAASARSAPPPRPTPPPAVVD